MTLATTLITKDGTAARTGKFRLVESVEMLSPYAAKLVFWDDWAHILNYPAQRNHTQVWGLWLDTELLGLIGYFYDSITQTLQIPFCERVGGVSALSEAFKPLSPHLFGLVCYLAHKNYRLDADFCGWVAFQSKPDEQLRAFYRKTLNPEQGLGPNDFILDITKDTTAQLNELIFEIP